MTKREIKYQEYDERIDRYLRKQMSDDERTAFEKDVNDDEELRKRLIASSLLAIGIAEAGGKQGQAQIDAIKQMSKEEFLNAARPATTEAAPASIPAAVASTTPAKPNGLKTITLWASSIAAAIIIAIVVMPMLNKPSVTTSHEIATAPKTMMVKATPKPTPMTLAGLSDKYNKPVPGESDELAAISNQIRNGGDNNEMMALAFDIEKAENIGEATAMGADNAEAVKEEQELFNDCVHWYKALTYLKANDKTSAVTELTILMSSGKTEELVKRATNLLKELEKVP